MKQYQQCLQHIIDHGQIVDDRTGVGTLSTFGYQMRYDLTEGFPIVTTKRVPMRLVVSELLWFLKGDTNIRYLLEHDNHIWDEWAFERYVNSSEYEGPDMKDFGLRALEDGAFHEVYQAEMNKFQQLILNEDAFAQKWGDLGPVYGKQWRAFEGIDAQGHRSVVDQIEQLLIRLRKQPHSRRHIISAWNPNQVDSMALPPCHTLFQFYVCDNTLSCQLYQRSVDSFLGLPFNIASYALLTHLIAREVGLEVGEFIHTSGDLHLYRNHLEQAQQLLERGPRSLPTLEIKGNRTIFELEPEDIQLIGYDPHPTIKAPIAV